MISTIIPHESVTIQLNQSDLMPPLYTLFSLVDTALHLLPLSWTYCNSHPFPNHKGALPALYILYAHQPQNAP